MRKKQLQALFKQVKLFEKMEAFKDFPIDYERLIRHLQDGEPWPELDAKLDEVVETKKRLCETDYPAFLRYIRGQPVI